MLKFRGRATIGDFFRPLTAKNFRTRDKDNTSISLPSSQSLVVGFGLNHIHVGVVGEKSTRANRAIQMQISPGVGDSVGSPSSRPGRTALTASAGMDSTMCD